MEYVFWICQIPVGLLESLCHHWEISLGESEVCPSLQGPVEDSKKNVPGNRLP